MKRMTEQRFVLCVKNAECADLETRKVYAVLADKTAEKEGFIRVIDESGEDYLYPQSYFAFIRVPRIVLNTLAKAV